MKNRYCVFDLETTSIESFKRFANPFDKRNKIVVVASLLQGHDPELLYDKAGIKDSRLPFDSCNFLVGHNIKFDLLYIWGEDKLQKWLQDGGRIWDTMTAEYLLSGQFVKYASLDRLTEQYGGELKDDKVTQLFKAGFGSDEIDPEILLPYAEGDVLNTDLIVQKQTEQAKREHMMPLMMAYMDHYLALCEMEANGLHFDLELAADLKAKYTTKVAQLETAIATAATDHWSIKVPFNPGSDEHISALLFNSTITIDEVVQLKDENGEYLRFGPKAQRAGQIKTRKEKRTYINKGFGIPISYTRPTRKSGVYSTDRKILKEVLAATEGEKAKEIINLLLEYREATKFLNTYLYGQKWKNKTEYDETGLIPLVQPIDNCIHHTLDTVQTKTGRLNSKNPNGQNIPADLLQLFTSRYGDKGQIVAIDYSQLEVRVQAFLTQSEQMIQDIKNNMDFHALRLSYAVDKPYEDVLQYIKRSEEWKLKRKKAKVISFEKAYGAAPQKIANTTGLPLATVQKIFQKEDERYPEVEEFYKDVFKEIKDNRIPTDKLLFIRDKRTGDTITRPGYYQGIGYYRGITGKKYHFYEKAVLTKYGDVFKYFNPPDVYNYPVQGLAADIVAIQVGRLFRFLQHHRDKCLLINEVHDEVVLDIKKKYMDELLPKVKEILEDVDGSFQKLWGTKFNVPIEVDISHGNSWRDCK